MKEMQFLKNAKILKTRVLKQMNFKLMNFAFCVTHKYYNNNSTVDNLNRLDNSYPLSEKYQSKSSVLADSYLI